MSEVPQMVRGDTTSAWGLWGSFLEKVVFAVFVAAAVAILNFVLGAWASGDQYRREQLGSALSGAASEVLSTRTQMATAFEAYVALFMGDWKSNNGATRENVQTLTVNLQEPIISARSFVDAYGGQNLQRITDIFYS